MIFGYSKSYKLLAFWKWINKFEFWHGIPPINTSVVQKNLKQDICDMFKKENEDCVSKEARIEESD